MENNKSNCEKEYEKAVELLTKASNTDNESELQYINKEWAKINRKLAVRLERNMDVQSVLRDTNMLRISVLLSLIVGFITFFMTDKSFILQICLGFVIRALILYPTFKLIVNEKHKGELFINCERWWESRAMSALATGLFDLSSASLILKMVYSGFTMNYLYIIILNSIVASIFRYKDTKYMDDYITIRQFNGMTRFYRPNKNLEFDYITGDIRAFNTIVKAYKNGELSQSDTLSLIDYTNYCYLTGTKECGTLFKGKFE